ncbi:hypothetical protein SS50377_20100 [Spironucleus salmonicida]|nr:hypothetical protein SS50377_20100 [Spironucleus salmonicida]
MKTVDFFSVLRVSDYEIKDYLGNIRYLKDIETSYIPALFTKSALLQLFFIDVSGAFIIPDMFQIQFDNNRVLDINPANRNVRVQIDTSYYIGGVQVILDKVSISLDDVNIRPYYVQLYIGIISIFLLITTYVIIRVNFSKIQQLIGYKASSILAIFLNKQTESMILKSQEHFIQQQFKFNELNQIQKQVFVQRDKEIIDIEVADSRSCNLFTVPGKLEDLFPQFITLEETFMSIVHKQKDEISQLPENQGVFSLTQETDDYD